MGRVPTPTIMAESFSLFPQSLRTIARIISALRHEMFVPNHFQLILYLPSYHPYLYSIDSVKG